MDKTIHLLPTPKMAILWALEFVKLLGSPIFAFIIL